MPERHRRLLYVFIVGLALCFNLIGMMGCALMLGAELPVGKWEEPIQLLLQEHSGVLLAAFLPGAILGVSACRLKPRSWLAPLAALLGACGLLGALIPLYQGQQAVRVFEQRMNTTLGADYSQVAEHAGVDLRPHPFEMRSWFNTPTGRDQVRVHEEVVYRTVAGRELVLDLYRPDSAVGSPVLVLVHGGGLEAGARQDARAWAQDFAERGYLVASVDYRLAHEASLPAPVEDVLCAVHWLLAQEPSRPRENWVGLIGFSSGGHLAILAGYWSAAGWGPSDCPTSAGSIDAVVAVSPVTDLSFYSRSILGFDPYLDPVRALRSSPVALAAARAEGPPLMVVHGHLDTVVDFSQTQSFMAVRDPQRAATILLDPAWSGHVFYALPKGLASQITLFYIDRFLAWSQSDPSN